MLLAFPVELALHQLIARDDDAAGRAAIVVRSSVHGHEKRTVQHRIDDFARAGAFTVFGNRAMRGVLVAFEPRGQLGSDACRRSAGQ
mgnify:CR=1 FL=1